MKVPLPAEFSCRHEYGPNGWCTKCHTSPGDAAWLVIVLFLPVLCCVGLVVAMAVELVGLIR